MKSTYSAKPGDLIIDYRHVDICYGEKHILTQVDFQLGYAEFCYLVGRSGSGKSSLLRSMYGGLPLQGQRAMVAGTDLLHLASKEVYLHKRNLGIIFQDFQLFADWTVARNLAFVLYATDWKDKAAIDKRITEVLTAVGLQRYRDTSTYQLSGGEQQRLAIARAILNQPALIIADEPTGNLDPESSDEILYLLSDIATQHKTAILLATHDYRIIEKFAARVYRCEAGILSEDA